MYHLDFALKTFNGELRKTLYELMVRLEVVRITGSRSLDIDFLDLVEDLIEVDVFWRAVWGIVSHEWMRLMQRNGIADRRKYSCQAVRTTPARGSDKIVGFNGTTLVV